MELKAGQVLKFKIQSVEDDHYIVVSQSKKTEKLLKRYTASPLVKNQFVNLHVLLEKDGKLYLSTKLPKLNLGDIGMLRVEDSNPRSGFFLNNGVERDLLLHKDEVFGEVEAGQHILVKIIEGNEGMLQASMKFPRRDVIKEDEYHVGDRVKGRVVSKLKKKDGSFKGIQILVDDELFVFIHDSEMDDRVKLNDIVTARIIYIRDDKKLNGTLKPHVKDRISVDKKRILEKLHEHDGVIPVNKKSSSESIDTFFGMSKKAFKRALLDLTESNEIVQHENKITLKH